MNDSEIDLGAYFERVGYRGPATPTLRTLTALHEAHVAAIPFENLDILLGRPIRLDLASLAAKLVTARRGGYCFEQNALFAAVLSRVGFDVTTLAARVRFGTTEVRPRSHMLLRVDVEEGPHVADVGFGADGLIRPIPLIAGREQRIGAMAWRLRDEGDAWVLEGLLEGAWIDLYAFTLERAYPADYEMANHFTSTYPTSRFVVSMTVQRSWADRRLVLRNGELVLRDGTAVTRETIDDPDVLLDVLRDRFDLDFPPGTRFATAARE